jgi:hypothetical protein
LCSDPLGAKEKEEEVVRYNYNKQKHKEEEEKRSEEGRKLGETTTTAWESNPRILWVKGPPRTGMGIPLNCHSTSRGKGEGSPPPLQGR